MRAVRGITQRVHVALAQQAHVVKSRDASHVTLPAASRGIQAGAREPQNWFGLVRNDNITPVRLPYHYHETASRGRVTAEFV
ncbi:hypothetical protein BHE74_00008554 [Ensete ventricosum]|nr:hypothetical protein BHE74_00008554 [Ensete ventricosum]